MHAWLCANLHHVHCRLSRCIGSVAVYVEYPSVSRALQSGAAAETQQVTVWPLRIWYFKCCKYRTAARGQTLALLCSSASHLLMNHILRSSCRFCRHMLMQKVRATALDVVIYIFQDIARGTSKYSHNAHTLVNARKLLAEYQQEQLPWFPELHCCGQGNNNCSWLACPELQDLCQSEQDSSCAPAEMGRGH